MQTGALAFQEGERLHFRISASANGYPCTAGEAEVRWLLRKGDVSAIGLRFDQIGPDDIGKLRELLNAL